CIASCVCRSRHPFPTRRSSDLNCAMCYWGEAYVLGPNINVPMDPSANAPAAAAAAKAKLLAAGATPREQALIAAVAARYNTDPRDRKSTRLNSSHQIISYAVFC